MSELNPSRWSQVQAFLELSLEKSRAPGLGIAMVSHDQLLAVQGFGLRDRDAGLQLLPTTLFPIASTTKAMNATVIASLVEEGLLDWETPVRTYLPSFRLLDPIASERVTIKDLVTMQSGLPRHDPLWEGNGLARADLVEAFAHLPLSASFRERFQYSNISVSAAGYIAEIAAGRCWEELLQERVLDPLGMNNTHTAFPEHCELSSSYHDDLEGRIVRTTPRTSQATAPSGGAVHSTLLDMATWVRFNLGDGALDGRRLVHSDTLALLHRPHIVVGDRSLSAIAPGQTYGLGWVIDSHAGQRRVYHTGYHNDVSTAVSLFPDSGIGLVSFVNLGIPGFAAFLNTSVFDLLCAREPAVTLAQRLAKHAQNIETNRRRICERSWRPNTLPSRPVKHYAGRYHQSGYGSIAIHVEADALTLQYLDLDLPLRHRHFDVWSADPSGRWAAHRPCAFDEDCPIQFHLSADGDVAELSIPLEPAVAPIRFTRQRDPAL